MIDPIQTLKDYDRFRYSKDTEGHEHDPANGQFTSGGESGSGESEKHKQIAHDLAKHITSGSLNDPREFRRAYADLEDHEKIAVAKELAGRGLLHPVDARKRKPMTGSEIYRSAQGQFDIKATRHTDKPTNRHTPFHESDEFKKMLGE